VTTAGGSAQRRYERASARHRAGRSARLVYNIGAALIIAVAVWVAFHQIYPSFFPWILGVIVFIGFAKAVVEPDHVRAWGIGAEGERVTGAELSKLPDGYEFLHDRHLPGGRGNVDHVVIGPGGVYVVESKRMAGKLTVRDHEVFIRGRKTGMVDQVLHQAEILESVLDNAGLREVPVRPILFVQKADIPFFVDAPLGVPIVAGGRGLRRRITSDDPVLTPEEVGEVADLLDAALPPMVRRPPAPPLPLRPVPRPTEPEPVLAACPRCRNEMVLRRNRQGQSFLGCSQFPNCRGTRPWRDEPG
jgi:hypothetical protein